MSFLMTVIWPNATPPTLAEAAAVAKKPIDEFDAEFGVVKLDAKTYCLLFTGTPEPGDAVYANPKIDTFWAK